MEGAFSHMHTENTYISLQSCTNWQESPTVTFLIPQGSYIVYYEEKYWLDCAGAQTDLIICCSQTWRQDLPVYVWPIKYIC